MRGKVVIPFAAFVCLFGCAPEREREREARREREKEKRARVSAVLSSLLVCAFLSVCPRFLPPLSSLRLCRLLSGPGLRGRDEQTPRTEPNRRNATVAQHRVALRWRTMHAQRTEETEEGRTD
jgi:hypothetical protein